MVRAVVLAALGLAMLGCYRAHGRDGAPAPIDASIRDAGRVDAPIARPDAGRSPESVWTLEARPAQLRLADASCTAFIGGSVVLHVRVGIDHECEHGGPVTLERAGGGTYFIRAHVWVDHRAEPGAEGCRWIAAIADRDVVVHVDVPSFEVIDLETMSTLRVEARDEGHACGMRNVAGEPCMHDCDCTPGLSCIPGTGDFAECFGGACARACNRGEETFVAVPLSEPDMSCSPFERCAGPRGTGLAASTCVPREADACRDGVPCLPGRTCRSDGDEIAHCEWDPPRVGNACSADRDCAPGAFCVREAGAAARCRVPCWTHDMRCPTGESCDAPYWTCRGS